VHVGATSQQARTEWQPHYEAYWAFIADLVQRHGIAAGRGGSEPYRMDYDTMLKGPAICGSAAEVTDRLLQIKELLSLDLHLAMFDLGGLPHEALEQTLQRFAEDVLPHIQI
jgi:alkanesulfonate monooxygenase SsuD/methylene tetrahydromethanopterin reductase-like flavin-dependent oxidoreductase (luciferase family)